MNFSKLPEHVKKAITTFPDDAEFNEMLNNDKILDELDEEAAHNENDFDELLCLIEKTIYVNGKKYRAISAKAWSYLFMLKSPLVQQSEQQPTSLDFDLFAYVVETNLSVTDPTENLKNCVGYCAKLGLDDDEKVIEYYEKQMKLAFSPMKMFPCAQTNYYDNDTVVKQNPSYDVDWLTTIITRVHAVTNLSPQQILELSMNTCCYYFAQWARLQGEKNIEKRSNVEITIAKLHRTIEIIVEALIKKSVIKPEERNEYIKLISSKKNG